MQSRVTFGSATHVGVVRRANEDQYMIARLSKVFEVLQASLASDELRELSGQAAYLVVVSDGIGGAVAGEQASMMVLQQVQRYMVEAAKWFFRWYEDPEATDKAIEDLQKGLERIDQAIIEASRNQPAWSGMAATLTVARILGPDLVITHVGDSRAYLFRNDKLQQVTKDHTVTQMLVDSGTISEEDAKHHHMRNIVVNVLGGKDAGVKGEIHQLILNDKDRLLLCTDGLTNPVQVAQIEEILRDVSDPQKACNALIQAALKQGGPDNITAVIADYQTSD
ncbi:MAG TPA: protein phosphatase 2C domain-containing protein [Acidobacteriota bacterium]